MMVSISETGETYSSGSVAKSKKNVPGAWAAFGTTVIAVVIALAGVERLSQVARRELDTAAAEHAKAKQADFLNALPIEGKVLAIQRQIAEVECTNEKGRVAAIFPEPVLPEEITKAVQRPGCKLTPR